MNERRRGKRYSAAYPIECKERGENCTLSLNDVSSGGVSFTSKEEIEVNKDIELQVFLKNKMFKVKAHVIHVDHVSKDTYNIGVQFLHTQEDFLTTFKKEIQDIIQFRRECNLYKHKDLSFKKASLGYLNDTSPSEV